MNSNGGGETRKKRKRPGQVKEKWGRRLRKMDVRNKKGKAVEEMGELRKRFQQLKK